MNDKKNDKPVEMPARGRPRKRDYNMDPVFKNEYMHKTNYNPPMGCTSRENSQEEMNLRSMCPYNVGEESSLLEQFTKIGDVFSSSNGKKDDVYQISPKDVQNSKTNYFYNSSVNSQNPDLLSGNYNHKTEPMHNHELGIHEVNYNMLHHQSIPQQSSIPPHLSIPQNHQNIPSHLNTAYHQSSPSYSNISSYQNVKNMPPHQENNSSNYQTHFSPQHFNNQQYTSQQRYPPYYEDHQNNFYNKQDISEQIDRRSPIYYENKVNGFPSYYNNRSKINNQGYFNSPQNPNFMRQNFYKPGMMNEELFENSWIYKKKRKQNNPIMWNYVKNTGENFQPLVHPSKYSSLDYIQGNDIFSRRTPPVQGNCNNSILPLFLNSNKEINEEYSLVINNFKQRISELDFTNVTVHQLKILMREFGLNHTGKKNELIDRAKTTLKKLEISITNAKKRETEGPKEETKEDEDYGNVFF